MDAPWDPRLYERFRAERARPFFDLLARVDDGPVRLAADLGCGTGVLTRHLVVRWPGARVIGVDLSPEMLQRSGDTPPPPGLEFVRADLATWQPPAPLDRIVSNAALHWVPDHAPLFDRLAGLLAPGGILAVQMPRNRDEAAYRLLDALLAERPWAGRVDRAKIAPTVESPAWYARRLRGAGLEAEIWETIYHHALASAAEIVEWMKGTALRTVLSALSAAEAGEFLGALSARIDRAYPADPDGILFPFRRLFFVARRP